MRFSVSKTNQNFEPVLVNNLEDLAQHILHYNYSMGIFEAGDRTNKSFKCADGIALDFDGGLTLKEAMLRFTNYRHVIATTRSHQKPKNGTTCDRFRVILFLDKPIAKQGDYRATVYQLLKDNPEADKACKDPARMFYPSTEVISMKMLGKLVKYVEASVKELVPAELSTGQRGQLSNKTKMFFMNGAPSGEGNTSLFKAAKDCQGQGYTQNDVMAMLGNMKLMGGDWRHHPDRDLNTINNAFKEESNDEPRVKQSAFSFTSMGELLKNEITLEWHVNKLCLRGGVTILSGRPKSGKSTLVRQLAKATLRGEEFLGRRVEKGPVLYLAIEEHPAMLQRQFKTIGITKDDNMMIHVGPVKSKESHQELINYMLDFKPALLVIDTLSLFGNFTNINDYEHVNTVMQGIREIARVTNTHVILIHHTNKGDFNGTSSIMGSQAILGAVDTAIMFQVNGERRFVHTTGRGVTNFNNAELIFDEKTELYSFKMEVSNVF